MGGRGQPAATLGIYEGIPPTERGHYYGGVLPDRITIYRNRTLRICDTVDDVIDEVHITVVHEIAHYSASTTPASTSSVTAEHCQLLQSAGR